MASGGSAWDFPAFTIPLAERSGARLCYLDAPKHSLLYSTRRSYRAFDPIPRSARLELGNGIFMQAAPRRDLSRAQNVSFCTVAPERSVPFEHKREWNFIHGGCDSKKVFLLCFAFFASHFDSISTGNYKEPRSLPSYKGVKCL